MREDWHGIKKVGGIELIQGGEKSLAIILEDTLITKSLKVSVNYTEKHWW